ncbi:hypothetical protein ACJX0J_040646, partial [Zea mays]
LFMRHEFVSCDTMTDASFLSYSQSFAITFEHFFDHNFQEAAIDEYFKPIDKNAKIIADMQLEKEEKQTKEMTKLMQEQMKMRREIMMTRSSDTKAGGKEISAFAFKYFSLEHTRFNINCKWIKDVVDHIEYFFTELEHFFITIFSLNSDCANTSLIKYN